MSTTTHGAEAAGSGAHETAEERHAKEHLALWLFIAGDAVFLALEVFTWFYLRALNTNGMWRGAACSAAKPCTDGLGNPITKEIAKADPWYSLGVAALAVVAALVMVALERAARHGDRRGAVRGLGALALVVVLAGMALQSYQFTVLPFSTIDGAYASSFEFFMGSTLAHLTLLAFVLVAVWNRARLGRYDEGRWHQTRLVRIFAVWIAVSSCILVGTMVLFA